MSRSLMPLNIHNADVAINRQTLLQDINLTVTQEPLSIVLGANGAGKTLLLKLCSGLLQTSRGQLQWNRSINIKKGSLPPLSLVFQKPVLLKRSVADNIRFALKGLPRQEIEERTASALQWADIDYLAEQTANTLSGGQQQLVAIARAWATRPEVLLLDEPTANLDPDTSDRVEHLVHALHQSGCKVIMSTHNLAQAQRLAGDIIFVDKGRVIEHSEAQQFFAKPKAQVARHFLRRQGFKIGEDAL